MIFFDHKSQSLIYSGFLKYFDILLCPNMEYQIEIKKIQEYKCDKSTASIRIRTEVGTTTIKVNDTTTILDVIQHINYLITSKGKELKNAKLQDTKGNVMNENKEEVVKTLKNKKLFNTMLRWV